MALAASCASGVVWGGILNPKSVGLADRRPFSTASTHLKERILTELIMSSIKAYRCLLGTIAGN